MASTAKFLRNEAIDFGGAKIDCYVLSIPSTIGRSGYTWWVDARRYLVLREDSSDSSSVFTTIRLGEPLSDDLFTFKPPVEAQRVDIQQ